MNFNIKIDRPKPMLSSFLTRPTCDALIKDIENTCYTFNISVNNLSSQRNCVLEIHQAIMALINFLKSSADSFRANNILNQFKSFILITNRTIDNFSLEVQIDIDNREYKIYLK